MEKKGPIQSDAAAFVPGLELCRRFYWEAVRLILEGSFPSLPHTAARIGSGSEVLGFDDAVSTDHHWGPSLQLFLAPADFAQHREAIDAAFRSELPTEFLGYPTNYAPPDPDDHGTRLLVPIASGPVDHMIQILTVEGYMREYLGFDINQPTEAVDWLTFPMQKLRGLTAGAIYYDEVGLEEVRAGLAFYPHDVWLYLLAAGWARIAQEEHLMGRAGSVGDEVGASLIGARLVRDVMRLCFLMERQYAPYPKWFGTAFRNLACAQEMLPLLELALRAPTWRQRERGLVPAFEALARMHNKLGIGKPLSEQATQFHGRPFQVMAMQGFAHALLTEITDPAVRQFAAKPPIGNIDLAIDNTDLLENPQFRGPLRQLYL